MYKKSYWLIIAFSALYLTIGGIYFLRDLNHEFVIYVAVIVVIFVGVFTSINQSKLPVWMLWALSIWGLMHVLGGAIQTPDGVLFAYRIYPFLDAGGEMYILKYDQVVHAYLYGLVAIMTYHIVRNVLLVQSQKIAVVLAVLTSVGISALNEIMEFLIAISLERNGVGGYENAMLDLIFNLSGAVIAVVGYMLIKKRGPQKGNMKCLYDGTAMKTTEVEDVHLDICPKCQGTWLDDGELYKLVGHFSLNDGTDLEELTRQWLQARGSGMTEPKDFWVEEKYICPKDGTQMQKHYFPGTTIGIDNCPLCKSFWAGGAELRAIAKRTKPNPTLDLAAKYIVEEFGSAERSIRNGVARILLFFYPLGLDIIYKPNFLLVLMGRLVVNVIRDSLKRKA